MKFTHYDFRINAPFKKDATVCNRFVTIAIVDYHNALKNQPNFVTNHFEKVTFLLNRFGRNVFYLHFAIFF